ncbi:VPS10 domain-containing protein [Ideonella sp. YS5]|uniref:VPS10 domain-containing protein n=1 Tax=Ideonella sp. YS5 TaxID=3453714 RepID=UPI003EEA2B6D
MLNRRQFSSLPALLVGALAGCGGSNGESAGQAGALGTRTMGAMGVNAADGAGARSTWKSVKIGGGGYVPGLVFHPTTPDLLYARTDIGGAYRWNPKKSSWVAITDQMGPNEGFYHGGESIALDPNDDSLLYLSTGMYNSADGQGRLYISSDRGKTWDHVELPFSVGSNNEGRAIGERMMVDPNQPKILYYGSRTAGLWRSGDRGRTWSQVTSFSSTWMTQEQIAASNGSAKGVEFVVYDTSTRATGKATKTIYVGVAPDYASAAGLAFNLYKSTNGGKSWTGIQTPVSGFHIPHMVRADDGMFYVAFTQGPGPGANGPARFYRFDGTTWTLLRSFDPDQWTSFGFGGVSVHGSGATTRIALGVTNTWGNWQGQPVVQLSDDAGATWREIAAMKPHAPDGGFSGWVDDVEIDPFDRDHILHVSGGGVWETRDASSADPSWVFLVEGIEETANVSMITPPAGSPYLLLNSSMDVGMLVHTSLDQAPTLGPRGNLSFGSGQCADMAWSTPSYIAAVGATTWGSTVAGVYSTDSGVTWAAFETNHPDALSNQSGESNIAVTQPDHAVWAPANSVPYHSTDNGKTWTPTNLSSLSWVGVNRSYRLAADRQNPAKVYAYDSGGAWWTNTTGKFYYSTDGGHSFTQSTSPALDSLRCNNYQTTGLVVNPYVEGDVWIADGNSLYHSVDSGVTWTKLTSMQSVWGDNEPWKYPVLFGATVVALGKPAPGASYSAAVYMVGTVSGVWGVYRSDDAGETWTRINDDQHQYGGIGTMAADHDVEGRVYISGGGRGVLYRG